MNNCYVQLFCGNGEGKSSAAIGKAIRMAAMGKSVVVVQFLKEKQSGDSLDFFKRLEPEVKLFRFQRFPENFENLTEDEKAEEILNIKNGMNFAKKVLVTEECDVLVLDEILGLEDKGIINAQDIRGLLENASDGTEIYLTGTSRCEDLWDCADEITELCRISCKNA